MGRSDLQRVWGGRAPRALWGRTWLYFRRQRWMRIWASVRVLKISGSRPASRIVPLQDSLDPFSQGLPGAMKRVVPPRRCRPERTARAVHAGRCRCCDPPACTRLRWSAGPGPAVLRPLGDAVVGPDGVRPLGAAPRAGAVRAPASPPPRGVAGHAPPRLTPQPFHPRVVHPPARGPQQGRDAPVAGPADAAGPGDDPGDPGRRVRRQHGRLRTSRRRLRRVMPATAPAAAGVASTIREVPGRGRRSGRGVPAGAAAAAGRPTPYRIRLGRGVTWGTRRGLDE